MAVCYFLYSTVEEKLLSIVHNNLYPIKLNDLSDNRISCRLQIHVLTIWTSLHFFLSGVNDSASFVKVPNSGQLGRCLFTKYK